MALALRRSHADSDVLSPQEEERLKGRDQAIIDEAKYRFKRAQAWEGGFLKLYNEDVKFANGDSDNGWQWPDNIKRDRDFSNRPCLTINKTKMHVLMLANEARQNQPQPHIKPVGDRVSYQAAEIWEGLLRHIQYVSNGDAVRMQAKESQLEGGIGYWRVQPDYEDDGSFNQELRISPLSVAETYLDCDIKRLDGSDAMWGFVFSEYNRKEWVRLFPDIPLPPPNSPFIRDRSDDWVRNDGVRVAEYYRIRLEEEKLLYLEDESGQSWSGLESEIPDAWRADLPLYKSGEKGADYKERTVMNRVLQWFKIGGDEILERRDGSSRKNPNLKGRYIPIVRMVGRERRIEGQLHRAGLVRSLKDPQRMYNYNSSGEVEVVALQTKTPWVVAAAAIEGNEQAWANANKTNAAYLTYKHVDDDGNEIKLPERQTPPTPAQGFMEGLRIAAAEMEMATGQYSGQVQAQQQTIERSPAAIYERSRMGQLANYDFTYSEMQAVRHEAVILLDLMPHYYDTERVVKIKASDGTISEIAINPNQEDACCNAAKGDMQRFGRSPEDQSIKVLFNPKVGKYAVEADVGPTYQTQREEAWEAGKELIKAAPEMLTVIGDLIFRAADWPMADKVAERMRRQIEATQPWLLDDSKTGALVQQLQQQVQQMNGQLGSAMEQLSEAQVKLKGQTEEARHKEELRQIEVYDAQTRRLTAEGNAVSDLAQINETGPLRRLIEQTVGQMLGFSLEDIERAKNEALEASEGEEQGAVPGATPRQNGASRGRGKAKARPAKEEPPLAGARKARDGHWYVKKPHARGEYQRVIV
jgi:hypothetical protein